MNEHRQALLPEIHLLQKQQSCPVTCLDPGPWVQQTTDVILAGTEWALADGNANLECHRSPLFRKMGKKKGKSQLRSFQVKHHCYGTESNCTGHQSNMNWRYPTPAGRWSHLLWWFCHFSIQTRVFDVQLQHLQSRWFGKEHSTGQIGVCCQQHSVTFIIFILHRTRPFKLVSVVKYG